MTQSDESRPKVTYKQVQLNYDLQNYVINIKTIPHRACLAKLRLGCHLLRIQTGKYECGGGPILVESRLCRQCFENEIEDAKHLLVDCKAFENIKQDNFKLIAQADPSFIQKAEYLLQTDKETSCKHIGKFVYEIYRERSNRQNKYLIKHFAVFLMHYQFYIFPQSFFSKLFLTTVIIVSIIGYK